MQRSGQAHEEEILHNADNVPARVVHAPEAAPEEQTLEGGDHLTEKRRTAYEHSDAANPAIPGIQGERRNRHAEDARNLLHRGKQDAVPERCRLNPQNTSRAGQKSGKVLGALVEAVPGNVRKEHERRGGLRIFHLMGDGVLHGVPLRSAARTPCLT